MTLPQRSEPMDVGRDQRLSVRHRDIARFSIAGDRDENGGFLDGKKPVSA